MNYNNFTTKLVLKKLEKDFIDWGGLGSYLKKYYLTMDHYKLILYRAIIKENHELYAGPNGKFLDSLMGGIDTALCRFYEKYLDYLTANDPTSDLVFMNID